MATKYVIVVTDSDGNEERTEYTRYTIAWGRRRLLFRQWREEGYHQKRGDDTLFRKGSKRWFRAEIEILEMK